MISDEMLREYAEAIRADVTPAPLSSVLGRARRGHRRQVAASAVAVVVVAAGVAVPIALRHNENGSGRRTQVVIASPSPHSSLTLKPNRYPLPALDAPGFPASVYPAAHRGLQPAAVQSCPSTIGLQAPTSQTRSQAIRVVRHFQTRRFVADLRTTDRAYWPQVATDWRGGSAHPQRPNGGSILHTGLLTTPWPPLGVPDPRTWVRESCGPAVMRNSYVVTGGPTKNPTQGLALQSVRVFVIRAGRPLLYFEYP